MIGQQLAIHSSMAVLPLDLGEETTAAMEVALGLPRVRWPELPRGAVVAIGVLQGAYRVASCEPGSDRMEIGTSVPGSEPLTTISMRPDEARFGDHREGRWLWALSDVTALTAPAAARGRRRLWYWTPPRVAEPDCAQRASGGLRDQP